MRCEFCGDEVSRPGRLVCHHGPPVPAPEGESEQHAERLDGIADDMEGRPVGDGYDPEGAAALRAGAAAIRELADWRNSAAIAVLENCGDEIRGDEHHCQCVPLLRVEAAHLRERVEEYEDLFRWAKDGAVVHFNECVIELAPATDLGEASA